MRSLALHRIELLEVVLHPGRGRRDQTLLRLPVGGRVVVQCDEGLPVREVRLEAVALIEEREAVTRVLIDQIDCADGRQIRTDRQRMPKPRGRPVGELEARGGPVHVVCGQRLGVVLGSVELVPVATVVPPSVGRVMGVVGFAAREVAGPEDRRGDRLERRGLPQLGPDATKAEVNFELVVGAGVAQVGPGRVLVLKVIGHRALVPTEVGREEVPQVVRSAGHRAAESDRRTVREDVRKAAVLVELQDVEFLDHLVPLAVIVVRRVPALGIGQPSNAAIHVKVHHRPTDTTLLGDDLDHAV